MFNITLCTSNDSDEANLKKYFNDFCFTNDISHTLICYNSCSMFLENYSSNNCDLLILSIGRNDPQNYFKLVHELRNNSDTVSIIIFAENYKFIHESFKIRALQYFVKPLAYDIFSDCMQSIMHIINHNTVLVNDIICIVTNKVPRGHNNTIYTKNKSFTTHKTLKDLMTIYEGNLIYAHRSALVNPTHILDINNGQLTMNNGMKLKIGRTYKASFKKKCIKPN